MPDIKLTAAAPSFNPDAFPAVTVPSFLNAGFNASNFSISSINGLKGQVGQTNYSAAKAGIIGFSKALALENANKGITVNVIAPGYVGTDMVKKIDPTILKGIVGQIPVGRLAEPEEIAALASYLVSDKAGFITGATFSINGGQYMQ